MCTNRDLFHQTVLQKCERLNNCSWDYGLLVFEENQQSAIQTKIEQHFGGFFQQIKVQQPIGRKAQNFELFSNILNQN
jgi:hypothetical protein